MAETTTTGVTEPAAGLFRARQFVLRRCVRPYVTPQELKDSIPLDRRIQNYDSAYHIIFTNVKTIQQFSPRTGGSLPPANNVAELGVDYAAHAASQLLLGGRRVRGLFSGELTPSGHEFARASVAQELHSLASRDASQPRSEPFLLPPSPAVRAYPGVCRRRKP